MDTRTARLSIAGAAALALACGTAGSSTAAPQRMPEALYACGSGTLPPPSKLILHPDGGVPGQYLVVLMDSVPDVHAAAADLTAKYGGELLYVYTAAIRGFALRVADAQAPALSEEPSVCWVEQDAVVSVSAASAPE
jgi:hypothetical protein